MKRKITHKAVDIDVHKYWTIYGKKKEAIYTETAMVCTGELLSHVAPLKEDGFIAPRWKDVNCKNCLKKRIK